jgi:hypothetical protein
MVPVSNVQMQHLSLIVSQQALALRLPDEATIELGVLLHVV